MNKALTSLTSLSVSAMSWHWCCHLHCWIVAHSVQRAYQIYLTCSLLYLARFCYVASLKLRLSHESHCHSPFLPFWLTLCFLLFCNGNLTQFLTPWQLSFWVIYKGKKTSASCTDNYVAIAAVKRGKDSIHRDPQPRTGSSKFVCSSLSLFCKLLVEVKLVTGVFCLQG